MSSQQRPLPGRTSSVQLSSRYLVKYVVTVEGIGTLRCRERNMRLMAEADKAAAEGARTRAEAAKTTAETAAAAAEHSKAQIELDKAQIELDKAQLQHGKGTAESAARQAEKARATAVAAQVAAEAGKSEAEEARKQVAARAAELQGRLLPRSRRSNKLWRMHRRSLSWLISRESPLLQLLQECNSCKVLLVR